MKGFRLRTRRLMAAPVLVLAVIAAVTTLVQLDKLPPWLAWLPPWGVVVIAAVLTALTVLVELWITRRHDKSKQERESLDLLRRHLGRQDRLPRIGEASAQALALRVHPATGLPAEHADLQRPTRPPKPERGRAGQHDSSGLDPDLPVFVDRDKGPEIRTWMQTARRTGGFLLLVGNSCVGKTRLLYESARQELSDFAVLAPDPGHGELINATAEATFPIPKLLIVWLDELQTFLEGPYLPEGATAITAGAIRRLLDAPTPVIIVGTLWREYACALGATQQDPVIGRDRALFPRTVEILNDNRLKQIPLESFSERERKDATKLADRDPRLARALADPAYNVTEALAGAPELIRRYERATEDQQAVIHAAADARRLGIQAPLTSDLLCAAARGYLTTLHPDDTWFEGTLKEVTRATQPQDRATAPLIPVLNDQHSEAIGYTVADYLLQHLTRQRRSARLSAVTWDALCDHPHTAADLDNLASSAQRRLLYRYAERLYQALYQAPFSDADEDDWQATLWLPDLLTGQGRTDEALDLLRQRAAAGDWRAAYRLADLLADQCRPDELRQRADAGDRFAARRLADLLTGQGRTDEALDLLRQRAAAGDWRAALRLVDLLTGQGRTGEALDLLRQRADTGDRDAVYRLVVLLAGQDRIDEALDLLRQRIAAGDWQATYWIPWLADLLAEQDRIDEAFDLRQRADTDDWRAALRLADLLTGQDRIDEALDLLRQRADAGDWRAALRLVDLLAEQGHADELRQRADAGDPQAVYRLVVLLAEQGHADEALDLLRQRADTGDWQAVYRLVDLLTEQGHADEALDLLRQRADTGDWFSALRLADLLAEQGHTDELRQRADAGDPQAVYRLADLLVEQGCIDELRKEVNVGTAGAGERLIRVLAASDKTEADRIRRFGLNPDGSIAERD